MAELYGDGEDFNDEDDGEKPIWKDDIDISDVIGTGTGNDATASSLKKDKKKKKKKKKDGDAMDDGGVDIDMMDADINVGGKWDDEEWDGTEEMRKKKVQEYMDEIYGLDFNDMVRSRSLLSWRPFAVPRFDSFFFSFLFLPPI